MSRRIDIIGYEGIAILDLAAPIEAFETANAFHGSKAYALTVVSPDGKPFRSEGNVAISAAGSFRDSPAFDTLIVPGGAGLREPRIGAPVVTFLKQRVHNTRRIVSICTGLEALAQAGLMDGRRATTHWRFAPAMARKFPQILLDANAIYLRDGKFYSSGGLTAGIDLSLALIAEDLGEKTALAVARELVVHLKRTGGQTQFSEPLQFQTKAGDDFSDLAAWILRNLRNDLSVESLAKKMNLGARHFSRRFNAAFGTPPATYVEQLRLDEARRRLPARNQTVTGVAFSVGYASADAFCRAFERRFGVSPSVYRKSNIVAAP
jgi:transcriptional regulator GlxA family with amidase domain